jgi:hypothetical protein
MLKRGGRAKVRPLFCLAYLENTESHTQSDCGFPGISNRMPVDFLGNLLKKQLQILCAGFILCFPCNFVQFAV